MHGLSLGLWLYEGARVWPIEALAIGLVQPPRPASSPLLDGPSLRIGGAAGTLKARPARGPLGLLPRPGYSLDDTQALAGIGSRDVWRQRSRPGTVG